MKILISAYACSPFQGSEPGVGWGFVKELSESHELHVIVEKEKFKSDIEMWLESGGQFANKVTFHFIQKKRNRWLRKLWPPSYYWYYKAWHKEAYKLAVELDRVEDFDLTHQLTMVGFREPGYLWQHYKPFVWGPVGGMGLFPLAYYSEVGLKASLYYFAYNIINTIHMRFSSRPRKAAKRARNALLTATPENQRYSLTHWGVASQVMTEVGLPDLEVIDHSTRKVGEPLRICWSGLHIPRKGLGLLLQALTKVPNINWQLDVLGEGPCTKKWQRLAQQLNIDNAVIFHGKKSREECLHLMQRSHVFVMTSLRDLTSTVIIEALACGLPVICNDHCGFSGVINEQCGIKLPIISPKQTHTDLAVAITKIEQSESFRQVLASGALERSQAFTWESKIKVLNKIYQEVVHDRANKEKDV